MKIKITDTDGTRETFTVKTLEELTIRDWVALTKPLDEADLKSRWDTLVALLVRLTGIPKDKMERMPVKHMTANMDKIEALMIAGAEARAKADAGVPPLSFTWQGVEYIVPQDPENDMTFGQYESLDKVLLPACETDAEGYTAILAVMCLPEGEQFSAANVKPRMEAFADMPVLTALDVCAFFFDNSETLKPVIARIAALSLSSLKLRSGQASPTT